MADILGILGNAILQGNKSYQDNKREALEMAILKEQFEQRQKQANMEDVKFKDQRAYDFATRNPEGTILDSNQFNDIFKGTTSEMLAKQRQTLPAKQLGPGGITEAPILNDGFELQIPGESKRALELLRGQNRQTLADIQGQNRLDVAQVNDASRLDVAKINAESRERIAQSQLKMRESESAWKQAMAAGNMALREGNLELAKQRFGLAQQQADQFNQWRNRLLQDMNVNNQYDYSRALGAANLAGIDPSTIQAPGSIPGLPGITINLGQGQSSSAPSAPSTQPKPNGNGIVAPGAGHPSDSSKVRRAAAILKQNGFVATPESVRLFLRDNPDFK